MSYMTDERRMIQSAARDFAMNEVLPIANKLDPEQGDIPMALRDKLAEMGYFGVVIPEEYGGLGLGAFEYALITEEQRTDSDTGDGDPGWDGVWTSEARITRQGWIATVARTEVGRASPQDAPSRRDQSSNKAVAVTWKPSVSTTST